MIQHIGGDPSIEQVIVYLVGRTINILSLDILVTRVHHYDFEGADLRFQCYTQHLSLPRHRQFQRFIPDAADDKMRIRIVGLQIELAIICTCGADIPSAVTLAPISGSLFSSKIHPWTVRTCLGRGRT